MEVKVEFLEFFFLKIFGIQIVEALRKYKVSQNLYRYARGSLPKEIGIL